MGSLAIQYGVIPLTAIVNTGQMQYGVPSIWGDVWVIWGVSLCNMGCYPLLSLSILGNCNMGYCQFGVIAG